MSAGESVHALPSPGLRHTARVHRHRHSHRRRRFHYHPEALDSGLFDWGIVVTDFRRLMAQKGFVAFATAVLLVGFPLTALKAWQWILGPERFPAWLRENGFDSWAQFLR